MQEGRRLRGSEERKKDRVRGIKQTSYTEAASLNAPSCLPSSLILLLNYCTDVEFFCLARSPTQCRGTPFRLFLILLGEECSLSFSFPAYCLPSLNRGHSRGQGLPQYVVYMGFQVHTLQSRSSVLGFGITISRDIAMVF